MTEKTGNPPISPEDIEAAAGRLAQQAVHTPLLESDLVNAAIGGRLLIKPECLQLTGSFKFRGAYNRLVQLGDAERARGVVAFSSGNHAQGVALAARKLGIHAAIVMPEDAPTVKKANTAAYGAELVLYDRYRENREDIAARLADARGATVVPSFDDVHIMAGQGTVGLEIARDLGSRALTPDQALICCGGGGLSSGSFTALKAVFPDMDAYTVEPAGFDDTRKSLQTGRRHTVEPGARSVCDALLSPSPGRLPFAVLSALGVRGLCVSDDQALDAVATAAAYFHLVAEPGGAVALAAALSGQVDLQGKVTVAVISGGNIDPDLLAGCVKRQPAWPDGP
ncbi:threonine ammonia-lyase [Eilatimonas milleporae]|uniref:L-threonine ammonia-lyase n=1 Tax=Eilatimonas milleporae TaxID=911205 RepID=A0A3M0CQB3_9PROT|nr:threonine/serine dehydratase [Eilatimonas milleporae]RMB08996.1 L-threonine ammonia-lyase [Eilatimonas milleporae]